MLDFSEFLKYEGKSGNKVAKSRNRGNVWSKPACTSQMIA